MKKRTYTGQALAIIMVILVLSSIIGFSIITRTMRDKKSVIQERDSSEAYEMVDMILDNMLKYPLNDWLDRDKGGMVLGTQYVEKSAKSDITNIFSGLESTLTLHDHAGICPLPGTDNQYTLKLTDTNENTIHDIEPGQAFTFIARNQVVNPACSIAIHFVTPIPENTGFMLNYIHIDGEEIIEYDYEHAETYCLGTNLANCSNFTREPERKIHNPATPFIIEIGNKQTIDKVQLIAINNKIRFRFVPTDACNNIFDMLVLRASATCNDTYRAKEVIVPKVRSNYSLFNYVIFNGVGSMLTTQ